MLVGDLRPVALDHDDRLAGQLAGPAVAGETRKKPWPWPSWACLSYAATRSGGNTSSSMSRSSVGASLMAAVIAAMAGSSSAGRRARRRTSS